MIGKEANVTLPTKYKLPILLGKVNPTLLALPHSSLRSPKGIR